MSPSAPLSQLPAVLAFAAASLAAPASLAVEPDAHWWSLQPIEPEPPPAAACEADANPVDAFIAARLAAHGVAAAPGADRRTLLRRLSFDLLGLPPSIEDVDDFAADDHPLAYERVVDRLLASPRHGERWARHWMDVAHFAESHGHDQDRIREHAWPYRDYLIDSFNADKPFARFVEEQVAADILYPEDSRAVPALGFLAAGPWDESTLRDIREDTVDRQIGRYIDRDDIVSTVMNTFASVTVQCARCHDHKFDPVSARDYYALQACFAGVDKATRRYDPDPAVHRLRADLEERLRRVDRGDPEVLLAADVAGRVEAWERRGPVAWDALVPETFTAASGSRLARKDDGSILAGGKTPEKEVYTLTVALDGRAYTALRLEALPDASLPAHGPGRAENGNFHLSEAAAEVFEPASSSPRPVKLTQASADFSQEGWTIAHAVDGQEATAWGIHPRVGEAHEAVLALAVPLAAPVGSRLAVTLVQAHGRGHVLGRFRLSATTEAQASRTAILPPSARRILARPAAERTEAERLELAGLVEREHLQAELAALPPAALVFAGASEFEPDASHRPAGGPRRVQVLARGDIHQPVEDAVPGALSCVTALAARFESSPVEGLRRAALARWLTAGENPLVWRSIVNRVWHYHFGRGLVDTPNDFGRMGGAPTHPELLDWLAAWFRDDAGGSIKRLHRLLVTSAAYRRAVEPAPGAAALDAGNRLWGRMQRLRLDAESIRDAILAVAGDLDERMGGPSDRQFSLRPGIHVTPLVDYSQFDVGSPGGRRRSVYRFLFRTLPDPVMDALDCPAGDQLTPVRNAGVNVQQALALWNSSFVLHHAWRLAHRVAATAPDVPAQARLAFQLALGRPPDAGEQREMVEYACAHGLAGLCRLIFNLNEFAFLN